jgi:hypothetical protein
MRVWLLHAVFQHAGLFHQALDEEYLSVLSIKVDELYHTTTPEVHDQTKALPQWLTPILTTGPVAKSDSQGIFNSLFFRNSSPKS